MGEQHRHFIPAAGHDWLLPLYDPLWKLVGARSTLDQLVEQGDVQPGHRVLDVGCGTGNLTLLIEERHPDADITGLDPDPKALARARRKAERVAASICFDTGFGGELPYPDASFDRVFSSFMLHHLEPDEKQRMLAEALRVLRPGGSLHVIDFGGSTTRADGFVARLLHSDGHLRGNFGGRIPILMDTAGFTDPTETGHRKSFFGRVTRYQASVPCADA